MAVPTVRSHLLKLISAAANVVILKLTLQIQVLFVSALKIQESIVY